MSRRTRRLAVRRGRAHVPGRRGGRRRRPADADHARPRHQGRPQPRSDVLGAQPVGVTPRTPTSSSAPSPTCAPGGAGWSAPSTAGRTWSDPRRARPARRRTRPATRTPAAASRACPPSAGTAPCTTRSTAGTPRTAAIGGNVSMVVSKSTDLGDSWQPVIARDARGKTGEQQESYRPITGFAVDCQVRQPGQRLHRRRPAPAGLLRGQRPARSSPIVAASTDGGKTFGEPINLAESAFTDAGTRQKAFQSATTVPNAPTTTTPPAGSRAATQDQAANFGGFGPSVTVDDKGTVYAVWPATYANLNPRPVQRASSSPGPTDKGKTWTTSPGHAVQLEHRVVRHGGLEPRRAARRARCTPWPTATRTVGVAGYQDIYYYRSTDGGQTWSERKNVTDDDPKQLFGQFYPNDRRGARRPGRDRLLGHPQRPRLPVERRLRHDVLATTATTWSANIRVTDQPIDRRIGVWSANFDITSPPGLALAKEYTMVAWDDTRNTDRSAPDATSLGGGVQDIYISADAVRGAGWRDVERGQGGPRRRGRSPRRRPGPARRVDGQQAQPPGDRGRRPSRRSKAEAKV